MKEYCAHCGTFVESNHFCATKKATPQAHIRVDLGVLREMLRLPKGVNITAVRAGDDAHQCIIELAGLALPAEGELIANYNFANHTIVTFSEFTKA